MLAGYRTNLRDVCSFDMRRSCCRVRVKEDCCFPQQSNWKNEQWPSSTERKKEKTIAQKGGRKWMPTFSVAAFDQPLANRYLFLFFSSLLFSIDFVSVFSASVRLPREWRKRISWYYSRVRRSRVYFLHSSNRYLRNWCKDRLYFVYKSVLSTTSTVCDSRLAIIGATR